MISLPGSPKETTDIANVKLSQCVGCRFIPNISFTIQSAAISLRLA
jgi:hypothetical protein